MTGDRPQHDAEPLEPRASTSTSARRSAAADDDRGLPGAASRRPLVTPAPGRRLRAVRLHRPQADASFGLPGGRVVRPARHDRRLVGARGAGRRRPRRRRPPLASSARSGRSRSGARRRRPPTPAARWSPSRSSRPARRRTPPRTRRPDPRGPVPDRADRPAAARRRRPAACPGPSTPRCCSRPPGGPPGGTAAGTATATPSDAASPTGVASTGAAGAGADRAGDGTDAAPDVRAGPGAQEWLATVKESIGRQDVRALPFGDPDLAALARAGSPTCSPRRSTPGPARPGRRSGPACRQRSRVAGRRPRRPGHRGPRRAVRASPTSCSPAPRSPRPARPTSTPLSRSSSRSPTARSAGSSPTT